jgi:hypothetical protein
MRKPCGAYHLVNKAGWCCLMAELSFLFTSLIATANDSPNPEFWVICSDKMRLFWKFQPLAAYTGSLLSGIETAALS